MPTSAGTIGRPAVPVTAGKGIRQTTAGSDNPAGATSQRQTGTPITLPDDVVTLSTSGKEKAESSVHAKKQPSVAVTSDERQALLNAGSSQSIFSIRV